MTPRDKDALISDLSRILGLLEKNFDLRPQDALALADAKTTIPLTVFATPRGPLESLVIYLRTSCGLDFPAIAKLLNRDYQTVWTSFRLGSKKPAAPATHAQQADTLRRLSLSSADDIRVPLALFSSRTLSVSEALIAHLHDTQHLSFRDIAALLKRDQRTIWTMHHRAHRKVNDT